MKRVLSLALVLALIAPVSSIYGSPSGAAGRIPSARSVAGQPEPRIGDRGRFRKTPLDQTQPERLLVKLKNDRGLAQLRQLGTRAGFEVAGYIPQLGWAVTRPVRSGLTTAGIASAVMRAGVAAKTAPEVLMHPAASPGDPLYGEQWGFKNTGAFGGTVGADAHMEPAWDWADGAGTTVAVIDTGVDFSRPDLAGTQWVNPAETAGNGLDDDGNGLVDDLNGWDFYNGDASVYDPWDGDKHGTHVAGTIAAGWDNGVGGVGTAPGTKIMALKFLGPGGGSDAGGAMAITYAVDNGADVVNASWGSSISSAVLSDAVAYAAARGVLIVCSAGNSGGDNDTSPVYPASYPATNVVSVAATTRTDTLASFSNRGAASVDLGAPGSAILSVQPRLGSSLLVDKSPYKVVYHAFPVESVTQQAPRDAIIVRSMQRLAESSSTPILIVDDSWPTVGGETVGARLSAYTGALSRAGYTSVTTWRRDTQGIPTPATMSGKVVVWFTGAASFGISLYQSYGSLSSGERTNLQTYLNGGGRMLISSGDLGYDMAWIGGSALTWYHSYMHAEYADDDPWTSTVSGSGGAVADPLFADITADVDDPLRYSDGCDDVCAYDSYATPLMEWDDYATISGTSMAAPHVTGSVALLRSRLPDLPADEVKSRLLATTRPLAALSGLTVTGGTLDTEGLVGHLDPPSDFAAAPGVGSVALSWANPSDADFLRTRVLAVVGGMPASADDPAAAIVYDGAGTTATHNGLTAGVSIGYAAYAQNRVGTWTEPVTLTSSALSPQVSDDSYATYMNRPLTVVAPGVRANDENDSGEITVTVAPTLGTVALEQDGGFVYTPDAGAYGSDSFRYAMHDGVGLSEATVTIVVRRLHLANTSSTSATPGTPITLTGTGFGDDQGSGYVTFGGVRGVVQSWSDTRIVAAVPAGAVPGYAGVYQAGMMSNGVWFRPNPRLDSLSTYRSGPGSTVTFTGIGFGATQGTGYVTFAGTRAMIVAWSDTSVTAIVPACTVPGYAGVAQFGAMSNGKWFVPYATPQLTSLSSYAASPGSSVTFTGTGFGTLQASGYVTFGGVRATVLSWSDTQVTAVVPAGTTPGYAGVSQNNLMSNGKWFRPTPRLDALSSYRGVPGTSVTFTGVGFGATQGTGYVSFAGTRATVVSWSDTAVTAIVPAGAAAGYAGVNQFGGMSNGKWFAPFEPPVVETLSATSASPGTQIVIYGRNFGLTQGSGRATFNGLSATVVSWSDTSVTAIVPVGTAAGYVGIVQNGLTSNGIYFVPAP